MNPLIKELYDYDPVDKAYVIKLAPDKYLDIFNTLDHYPIRKRDINQTVLTYIEDCSSDIPLKVKIKIEIKIKNQQRDPDMEERTIKGIRNYFSYILFLHKKSSKNMLHISFIYMLVFLFLTIITFGIEALDIHTNILFVKTVLVGLSIGSWVFLWEAIAGIAIKNGTNRYMIKTYKRLAESHLFFLYN